MIDKAFSPKAEYFKMEGNNKITLNPKGMSVLENMTFFPLSINLSTQIIVDWFPVVLRSWACEPKHSQSQIVKSEKSKSIQCSAASFNFLIWELIFMTRVLLLGLLLTQSTKLESRDKVCHCCGLSDTLIPTSAPPFLFSLEQVPKSF